MSQGEDHKVTIIGTNVPLEVVFKQINEQTGLAFMYDAEAIDVNRKVSPNYLRKPLYEVLNGILVSMGISWRIQDKNIQLQKQKYVPGTGVNDTSGNDTLRIVRGKVTDGDGKPVAGATIMIKGRGQGTTTDASGNFVLNDINKDAELQISSMGYEARSISVKGASLLVRLNLYINNLEPVSVISTGYQQLPRERSTGSFVLIGNQLLNRMVSRNVLDRLGDVAPGVLFNPSPNPSANEPKISIRGRSTIFASPEPLIVLDNFPYESDINNINPNDIESITILKDAAATSIWGVKAGNGVIVITRKSGQLKQKARVSFNSNITFEAKPNAKYASQLTSAEFIEVEKFLFANGYYDPRLHDEPNVVQSNVVDLLEKRRKGLITEELLAENLHDLGKIDARDYIEKYFYQPGIKQQYSINLSGGSNNSTYYIAAGYDGNRDNLVGNHDERYTLTIDNRSYLLNNKLEISSAILLTNAKTGASPRYSPKYPYERPADDNGNALPVIANHREAFVDTAGKGLLLDWRYYPLNERDENINTTSNDYRINLGMTYSIAKGLKVLGAFQYGRGIANASVNQSLNSYYTRDMVNSYSQVNYLQHSVNWPIPIGDIVVVSTNAFTLNNYRLQAAFDRTFENHTLTAIMGFEARDRRFESSSQGMYGYDSNTATDASVDYWKNYYRRDLGYAAKIPEISNQGFGTDRFRSYYINVAYIFKNKYTITASAREDASNLFGVKTNQKGLALWSVGGKWNVSDEKFYRANWLPKLALRLTTGISGNVDRTVSALITMQDAGTDQIYGTRYANIVNPPNPSLRWEKVRMINGGLDFTLAGGIISGNVDAYWKKSTDLIANTPVAPQTGNTQLRANAADMKTKGIDINITSRNISRKLKWETDFLFSHVSDIITNYKTKQAANNLYIAQNFLNPLEGKPYAAIFSFRHGGLNEKGKLISYLNGHTSEDYAAIYNSADPNEMVFNGSAVPTVFGAVRNTFTYNNFSLSFNISYKAGYNFRRSSVNYTNLAEGDYRQADFNRRWKSPGDEQTTNVPAMIYPFSQLQDEIYKYSDLLVEKADHIRLQDIRFSWNIPAMTIWPGAPVAGCLYCYIRNIGLLWKSTNYNIDPDAASADGVPSPLTVSIGFSANF